MIESTSRDLRQEEFTVLLCHTYIPEYPQYVKQSPSVPLRCASACHQPDLHALIPLEMQP